MAAEVKVSIICLAYNQEKFIEQTLDSFLMQKTNFNVEIIINDDASTDRTAAIIHKYTEGRPKLFRPIFQTTNQFSSGSAEFINNMFRMARGDYIAFCEGDDFWTDPDKLQKQVDFLEAHPDYALCFHPVRVFFENGEEDDSIYPLATNGFTLKRLLQGNFMQANSVMYRRQDYKDLATDIMPRDWYWHLYHAQFGKIGFINKVMSAYRRHPGGIWWNSYKRGDEFWERYGLPHLALYEEVLKIYGSNAEYRKIIYESANYIMAAIIGISNLPQREKVFQRVAQKYSGIIMGCLDVQNKQLASDKQLLEQNVGLQEAMRSKENSLQAITLELARVKSSRAWRAGQKARAVQTKLKRK